MKRRPFLLLALAPLATTAEPLRGPLPEEQRALIRQLAAGHEQLERKVELVDGGYRATTTSADPELARALVAHVRYMKKRLGAGAMVRRWDPAFRELSEHAEHLETRLRILERGVEVEVLGTTPEAVRIARHHATIVSGFVEQGAAAVQREHPPAPKE